MRKSPDWEITETGSTPPSLSPREKLDEGLDKIDYVVLRTKQKEKSIRTKNHKDFSVEMT